MFHTKISNYSLCVTMVIVDSVIFCVNYSNNLVNVFLAEPGTMLVVEMSNNICCYFRVVRDGWLQGAGRCAQTMCLIPACLHYKLSLSKYFIYLDERNPLYHRSTLLSPQTDTQTNRVFIASLSEVLYFWVIEIHVTDYHSMIIVGQTTGFLQWQQQQCFSLVNKKRIPGRQRAVRAALFHCKKSLWYWFFKI